jgi:hypothetical protein
VNGAERRVVRRRSRPSGVSAGALLKVDDLSGLVVEGQLLAGRAFLGNDQQLALLGRKGFVCTLRRDSDWPKSRNAPLPTMRMPIAAMTARVTTKPSAFPLIGALGLTATAPGLAACASIPAIRLKLIANS